MTSIKQGKLVIVNVYKPPNEKWPRPVLLTFEHPSIYVGAFNSHHMEQEYEANKENGEDLTDWISAEDARLVYNANQPSTFRPARWGQDYNPDLTFISTDGDGASLLVSSRLLSDFPHSQHQLAISHVGIKIPVMQSKWVVRWNLGRADWSKFTAEVKKTHYLPNPPNAKEV